MIYISSYRFKYKSFVTICCDLDILKLFILQINFKWIKTHFSNEYLNIKRNNNFFHKYDIYFRLDTKNLHLTHLTILSKIVHIYMHYVFFIKELFIVKLFIASLYFVVLISILVAVFACGLIHRVCITTW